MNDFQEPRKPPDDEDADYPPLRVPRDGSDDNYHDENVGSLDMDNQSSFLIDDDRNSPRGSLPYRRDRADLGSHSGDGGGGSGLFSPQPFAAPGEELSVDGGIHEQQQQLLPPQSYGDRCSTRGKQQARVVRGRARARSQVGLPPITTRHETCANNGSLLFVRILV